LIHIFQDSLLGLAQVVAMRKMSGYALRTSLTYGPFFASRRAAPAVSSALYGTGNR